MKTLWDHKKLLIVFLVFSIGILSIMIFLGRDFQFYFESKSKQYIDYESYLEDLEFYSKQSEALSDQLVSYMDQYSNHKITDEELQTLLRENSQNMRVIIKAASDLRMEYQIDPEVDADTLVFSKQQNKHNQLKKIYLKEMKTLIEIQKPDLLNSNVQFTAFVNAGSGGSNTGGAISSSTINYNSGSSLSVTRHSNGNVVNSYTSPSGKTDTWTTDRSGKVINGSKPQNWGK